MSELKIGLIWADPYKENMGVAALAYSSLFLLQKIAKREGLKFIYFIISQNPQKKETISIIDENIEVMNIKWSYNGGFKSTLKLILVNSYQLIGLLGLDLIFDVGAGDSFSDIYGIRTFRKINGTRDIIHFLGKKVILLPQTIGPFNSKKAQRKACTSIEKSHVVLSRDNQSYSYVKCLSPNVTAYESIDMAFFMPFKRKNIGESSKIKIGINVSGLLWNGGYTSNNQFGLKIDYRNFTKEIIQFFINIPEAQVFLLAHVSMKDYNNLDNDFKICQELNTLYPNTVLSPFFSNPIEAKSFISGFDFFVGARMHACIAAFSTGVPVFPLAYSRKFNGLFGDSLNYRFYADMVAGGKDEVLDKLKYAYYNRDELKESIDATKKTLSDKESELLTIITEAIVV